MTAAPAKFLAPAGTVAVAATTTPFVAKDRFVVSTNKDAAMKISYLGDNFKTWFLGKTEAPFAGSTLHYAKLTRYATGCQIVDELGGDEKAETTLVQIFSLMEAQKNGTAGPLLNNSYANIFPCVRDANAVLRAVDVGWDGVGWFVYAYAEREWKQGNQVFCRDSR